jgi:hypothetical protein
MGEAKKGTARYYRKLIKNMMRKRKAAAAKLRAQKAKEKAALEKKMESMLADAYSRGRRSANSELQLQTGASTYICSCS